MKKSTFISSILLLAVVVTLLVMACQKDQNPATASKDPSENTNIKHVAGNGAFSGSIDGAYAAALQQNFAKEHSDEKQTLSVAFSAKELSAFISSLQTQYKSDIIYVNFGLYGKGALAPNPKDNGRMTVFFTGNNIAPTGSVKTDATSDPYYNHGGLVP